MSTISIQCLCRNTNDRVKLSAASLPSDVTLCHCEVCRKTSGVLFTSYLPVTQPPSFLGRLIEYRVSEESSRYFCGYCGSHVAAWSACSCPLDFSVASGLVQHDRDVSRVVQHVNHKSTLDGGLSVFLTIVGDRHVGKEGFRAHSSIPEQIVGSVFSEKTEEEETLHASCHCGGVTFYITRPNVQSTAPHSPWADLLVPYISGSSENPEDVKWWLRANKTKYLAGTCACRSCRMASGFPIQCWAFIPKVNIRHPDGRVLDFKAKALKQYESSPGIYREFCGGCGATVFWHSNERPEVIDVSVGLFNAQSGSRAEGWLEWEGRRVSFIEEAMDRELVEALKKGMQYGA